MLNIYEIANMYFLNHISVVAYPSKFELVQSKTLSLLFFIRRKSSQLSHPSNSNWSKVCGV